MTKVLKSLGNKQASELYYYITNLQQENEKLRLEIERLNDVLIHKPDEKITLKTNDGKEMFIIQSERIDMQEELNKTITTLYERINKAIEELNKHSPDVDGLFTIMWNARNILKGGEDNE